MSHLSLGRFGFLVLGGAVAACGGKAVMDGSPNAGGSGGSGGAGAGTTTTWTTTTTTTSTTGGGPGCYETHDSFLMDLSTWNGIVLACGVVGQLTIDSCPPNADCMPMVSNLNYSAPGLTQNIPIGTYIEVHAEISGGCFGACVRSLEIWNLPQWGGVPNPSWPNPSLWFAAVDGTVEQQLSAQPFLVDTKALNCYPGGQNCGAQQDDFVLHVSETASPQNAVDVPMGQNAQLVTGASSTPDYFTVRNLRSYESGVCDDGCNYAWWARMELAYN